MMDAITFDTILHRDQRTTYVRRLPIAGEGPAVGSTGEVRRHRATHGIERRKKWFLSVRWLARVHQRATYAFAVGAYCLLVWISCTPVVARPIDLTTYPTSTSYTTPGNGRSETTVPAMSQGSVASDVCLPNPDKPFWVNPSCTRPGTVGSKSNDEDPLGPMLTELRLASNMIGQNLEEYVRHTYGDKEPVAKIIENHKNQRYEWLPTLTIDPSETLLAALPKIYHHLQTIAVPVDHVDRLSPSDDEMVRKIFAQCRKRLFHLLDAMERLMNARCIQPYPDVSSDVMDDDVRSLTSNTDIDLRNFIILREYNASMVEFMAYMDNRETSTDDTDSTGRCAN